MSENDNVTAVATTDPVAEAAAQLSVPAVDPAEQLGLTFQGISTVSGPLSCGVEYPAGSGLLHYDFALRLPMIDDNIAVLQNAKSMSNMQVRTALFARCLTALGTIPAEAITEELLGSSMVDDDFDVLAAAEGALKKKRKRPSSSLPDSGVPSSSSDPTVSPSPASVS